ncbi:MAG: hypothetical protein N2C14_18390, partial [Planctomycetales bacterium]
MPGQPQQPGQPMAGQPMPGQPMQPGPRPMVPGQPMPAGAPVPVGGPRPVGGPVAAGGSQQPGKMRDPAADGEEQEEEVMEAALRGAPPWLISAVVHAVIILVLGLWWIYYPKDDTVVLTSEISDTEEEGEQLEDDSFMVESDVPEVSEDVAISELPPVEDPFAAPANLEVVPLETGTMAISRCYDASTIGMALNGRQAGMKSALLGKYGGNGKS